MARNRSNRGSGSARRGRDDAPQHGVAGEQKPVEDRGAARATAVPATAGSASAGPGARHRQA